MNSSTQSSILFSLVLILIIGNVAQARVNLGKSLPISDLITKVCDDELVIEKAKCIDILTSNPKILAAKSPLQISKLILTLAVNKAGKGQKFLQTLAEKDKSPAIQQCAGSDYDAVIASFQSALKGIENDPITANYDAKIAGDDADNCAKGLAEAKIVNPAVTKINDEIMLLSDIAFGATNLIERKTPQ
ncbi:hypothetical protein HN51_029839 [Arachis hypogaea]|uniref:Pectinesterase inhibitor domain-containing protein n=1 Tax=Arachis hypogaea TaxID=3818 RepID=A0A445BDE8_ARAHY|nr:uncharacterized protein LOC112709600 [Arachis hypogaea]QHO36553.1 uncharacterized protein DS421_9g284760 [Arachis hypogaea]RYR36679.1 hypothetical protein Ahy_A09g041637 [Arachis hypogaea]